MDLATNSESPGFDDVQLSLKLRKKIIPAGRGLRYLKGGLCPHVGNAAAADR